MTLLEILAPTPRPSPSGRVVRLLDPPKERRALAPLTGKPITHMDRALAALVDMDGSITSERMAVRLSVSRELAANILTKLGKRNLIVRDCKIGGVSGVRGGAWAIAWRRA